MKSKISILMAFVILISFTSCGNKNNDAEILCEFNDSSKIITQKDFGADFHLLYDHIGIYTTAKSVTTCIMRIDSSIDFNSEDTYDGNLMLKIDNSERLTDKGLFAKYAFSDKGYIAYCNYERTKDNETVYCIYSVSADKVYEFENMTALYQYAQEQNFTLGAWYYLYSSATEQTVCENNGWLLITVPNQISSVRNGYEDMFAGEIDKYISENQFLAFHIKINNIHSYKLRAFENPILTDIVPTDENTPKKLFPPPDFEGYIIVDTSADSYEIFDSKKDAENYLKENNISAKWEKVTTAN